MKLPILRISCGLVMIILISAFFVSCKVVRREKKDPPIVDPKKHQENIDRTINRKLFIPKDSLQHQKK